MVSNIPAGDRNVAMSLTVFYSVSKDFRVLTEYEKGPSLESEAEEY